MNVLASFAKEAETFQGIKIVQFLSARRKGELYAITSGLSYSLIGYFGMSMYNAGLSINNMLFWRFLLTGVIVGFLVITRTKAIRINYSQLAMVLFLGAPLYCLGSITCFIAFKYIGTGLTLVIFFTYPAFVMFANWLLYRTHISRTYYISVIIIIIGLLLLVDINQFKFDMIGIGFSLISSVSYASYIVVSKKVANIDAMISTFLVSIISAIICLILAIMDESYFMPLNFEVWLNIAGVAIICTAIPIILFLASIKYISSEEASILSVLEPVFVVIFGVTLLGEKISTLQFLGVTTILAGALMTLFSKHVKAH